MPIIDRASYPKAQRPIGCGYDRRPKGFAPSSLLIHTTNGRAGSALAAEARFLCQSDAVGAHYLIGKQGQILELLDPLLRAWHAGAALPAYLNSRSIGIEVHHAVGEAWTAAQHDALTWLCRDVLMPRYGIVASLIDTHRAVALPRGRKIDPSDWSDADFYAWRAALAGQRYVPQLSGLASYIVRDTVNVRQGPTRATPIALNGHAVLAKDFPFQSDVVVPGERIGTNNQWVHLVTPAAWGFVHSSCVQRVA